MRDQGDLTRRITWSLFAIVGFAIFARFAFRAPFLRGTGFGFDDWTIFLAALMIVPLNALIHDGSLSGLGHDVWEVSFPHLTKILYLFWIGEFLYVWIMSISKISVILLYLRVWAPDTRTRRDRFRMACFCMIIFLIVFPISLSLALGFECNPISYVSPPYLSQLPKVKAILYTNSNSNIKNRHGKAGTANTPDPASISTP